MANRTSGLLAVFAALHGAEHANQLIGLAREGLSEVFGAGFIMNVNVFMRTIPKYLGVYLERGWSTAMILSEIYFLDQVADDILEAELPVDASKDRDGEPASLP